MFLGSEGLILAVFFVFEAVVALQALGSCLRFPDAGETFFLEGLVLSSPYF